MDKKGSMTAIIVISFVVILVIVGIVLVMVLIEKNNNSDNKEQLQTMKMFIMPRDKLSLTPIETNYLISYKNKNNINQIYSQGKLENSWNEVTIPKDYNLSIYCWSNEYYLTEVFKKLDATEILLNKTMAYCDLSKIGNITINHTGTISTTYDLINLNIQSVNNYQKLGICFAWTTGIIDVSLKDYSVSCDYLWVNYSYLDSEGKTIKPENQYICDNWVQTCSRVEGNRCFQDKSSEVPERYLNKVDKCYNTGKYLKNETLLLTLEVKSNEYKNEFDELKIYVYDSDRQLNNENFIWTSENVGYNDNEYTIKYGE